MGVGLLGAGAFVPFAASRASAAIVRVSIAEGVVTLAWRNKRRVVKTERVLLSDVVEVVVTDNPSSSGGSWFGFALGMKNGEIDLVTGGLVPAPEHYVSQCRCLAQFLGVPTRIPPSLEEQK
jgi:hypothetical protein